MLHNARPAAVLLSNSFQGSSEPSISTQHGLSHITLTMEQSVGPLTALFALLSTAAVVCTTGKPAA